MSTQQLYPRPPAILSDYDSKKRSFKKLRFWTTSKKREALELTMNVRKDAQEEDGYSNP